MQKFSHKSYLLHDADKNSAFKSPAEFFEEIGRLYPMPHGCEHLLRNYVSGLFDAMVGISICSAYQSGDNAANELEDFCSKIMETDSFIEVNDNLIDKNKSDLDNVVDPNASKYICFVQLADMYYEKALHHYEDDLNFLFRACGNMKVLNNLHTQIVNCLGQEKSDALLEMMREYFFFTPVFTAFRQGYMDHYLRILAYTNREDGSRIWEMWTLI